MVTHSGRTSQESDAVVAAEERRRLLEEATLSRGESLWSDAARRIRRNRVAMASLAFLGIVAFLALITPALPLQSPQLQNVKERKFLAPSFASRRLEVVDSLGAKNSLSKLLQEFRADGSSTREGGVSSHPYSQFWNQPGLLTRLLIDLRMAIFGDWCLPSVCGTDELGRDVLARLLWGARVSLMVGLTAALVSLVIGVTYGAFSGYVGGLTDAVMMRIVDVLYSVPFLFIVIFLISLLSNDEAKQFLIKYGIDRMMIFYIVIGLVFWLTMARVVRGQVLSLKNEQFIDAARVVGSGPISILFRHLIPNVSSVVIVYLTLTIPSIMLFEAMLSFLGLGVSAPDVSWGLLLDEGVRVITPVKTYWWLVAFPGIALASTLLALNLLGDGLRDALDPRLKNKG